MKTVMVFGDSNAHGTVPSRDETHQERFEERWPVVMGKALGASWRVIEEGHPGRTTVHDDPVEGPHKNGLAHLLAALESHRPLDLVVLALGTNDLKARFRVSAGEIARSVERLIAQVRASGSGPDRTAPRILVITPPPVLETERYAPMFQGAAAVSAGLADAFAAMVAAQGVAGLDAGAVVVSSQTDGIHFDADQHRLLGQAVARRITDMGD